MAIKGRTESGVRRTWGFNANQRHRPYGWRIVRSFVCDGRLHELHATKGWRISQHKGGGE